MYTVVFYDKYAIHLFRYTYYCRIDTDKFKGGISYIYIYCPTSGIIFKQGIQTVNYLRTRFRDEYIGIP